MDQVTITVNNPTIKQLQAIHEILKGQERVTNVAAGNNSLAPLSSAAKTKKKAEKTAPSKTVSKDEDEDFGEDELDEDDLQDENESDADDADEDEDDSLSFDTVRAAINQLGADDPDAMDAILASFNIKSSKELKVLPKKWEAVYRKVKAKLTPVKKKAKR